MPAKREFKFFNHSLAPEITHRNLPHWEQPEVCYFLTWRLNDSLPVEVVKDFLQRRDIWLRSHGIVPDIDRAWHAEIALLPKYERAEQRGRVPAFCEVHRGESDEGEIARG